MTTPATDHPPPRTYAQDGQRTPTSPAIEGEVQDIRFVSPRNLYEGSDLTKRYDTLAPQAN